MRTFLVESYEPRGRNADARDLLRRARTAAATLSSRGTDIRYLRSFYVPEDEMRFHIVEAESAEAVAALAGLAALDHERILEAV
jgi:hypothetical protein